MEIMNLIKAFAAGTVNSIEKALEAMMDLPYELGIVFKALVKKVSNGHRE